MDGREPRILDLSMRARFAGRAFACAALVFATRTAMASPDEAAQARNLAQEGGDLLDAKRYADALDRLTRAEALYHAPTNMVMMGQAEEGLGHLASALAIYEKLAAEPIPGTAPRPFLDAQRTGKERLRALLARVPSLLVNVRGLAAGEQADVRIDGKPFAVESATAVRLDPGSHTITVDATGHPHVEKSVTLPEKGAVVEVEVPLASEHEAALPPHEEAPPAVEREALPALPPAAHHAGGSLVPAFVAFGVGAAGLATGAVTGAISLSKVSDLHNRCPSDRCGPAEQSEIDSTKTMGWVSTIGFAVGGAGVATGAVLLLLRSPSSDQSAATGHKATVVPFVGWNSAGLAGTF
jgi:hypothetical protein